MPLGWGKWATTGECPTVAGSTSLKAARTGQSAHQARLGSGMAGDQAFSQAVSRAWHCSQPPGCLEMGASPFGQPGPQGGVFNSRAMGGCRRCVCLLSGS